MPWRFMIPWRMALVSAVGSLTAAWGFVEAYTPSPAHPAGFALIAQDPPPSDYAKNTLLVGLAGLFVSASPLVKLGLDYLERRRADLRADRDLEAKVAAIEANAAAVAAALVVEVAAAKKKADDIAVAREGDLAEFNKLRTKWHDERDNLGGRTNTAALRALELEAQVKGLTAVIEQLGHEHTAAINTNAAGVRALASEVRAADKIPSSSHLEPPVLPESGGVPP